MKYHDVNSEADSHDSSGRWAEVRARMVTDQLMVPGRGVRDPRVLAAMRSVPRHEFVPDALRRSSYQDQPLPIGHGQTISQPFIVAFMTECLATRPTDRILEIGTGSGYQAAILSRLVSEIFSIEVVEALARRANSTLTRLGYENVHVRVGDGSEGWPEEAPFDGIIVTCAPDAIPPKLIDQLAEGGRMVIPVGDFKAQELYLLAKRGGRIAHESVMPVRFVPLTHSGQGNLPE